MKFWTYLAIALLACAAFGTTLARANPERVTHGDAMAVWQAFNNGGTAADETDAAPTDGLFDGLTTIRPLAPFAGKHYCELDWHLVALALTERGSRTVAVAALEARLAQPPQFWIDGVSKELEQTAIKRTLRENVEAYWTSFGKLLSPMDLTPGAHTLRAKTFGPFAFDRTITFHIDAAGTGTCL